MRSGHPRSGQIQSCDLDLAPEHEGGKYVKRRLLARPRKRAQDNLLGVALKGSEGGRAFYFPPS